MRYARTLAAVFLCPFLAIPVFGQQAATSSSPQALALLQKSLAVLTGGNSMTDVTLSGPARRIAGSDDESRSAAFKALASGAAKQATTGQSSTTTVQRDPQALAILQQSFVAMGGSVPSDSTATGTVTITSGTSSESGTISILTRGSEQSSEQIQTSLSSSTIVYSNLQSNAISGSASTPLSAQLAASSRSVAFPLVTIASALNNTDWSFIYVGLESLNGLSVHHIRYYNTFNSHPKLQFLSEFTVADIWIDAASGLPQRICQTRRAGSGSEPPIALDTYFSNYQKVAGAAYPFSVQKTLNGSPWVTITIANVAFNTGLTDANFSVQ